MAKKPLCAACGSNDTAVIVIRIDDNVKFYIFCDTCQHCGPERKSLKEVGFDRGLET